MKSIKDFISEVNDGIVNCRACVGHPKCELADTNDCDDCAFANCQKVVCRLCHPSGFSHLSSYSPRGYVISEDHPCDEIAPLCFYWSFHSFKIFSVPDTKSELVEVLLALPESGKRTISRRLDNLIDDFRQAALSYIDYTLLKRSFDGKCDIDAMGLYNTLGIVYSRDKLEKSIDPREWAILTNSRDWTFTKNLQAPILTKTSVAQVNVNYNNLWSILVIRDDFKSIFITQIKDCRERFKKGAKGKTPQEHTTVQDFIALGYTLYNLNFVKEKGCYGGCRPFISRFLDILSIPHGDIKLQSVQASETIAHSLIASIKYMKQ